jgi:hypothetical protein
MIRSLDVDGRNMYCYFSQSFKHDSGSRKQTTSRLNHVLRLGNEAAAGWSIRANITGVLRNDESSRASNEQPMMMTLQGP